MKRGLVGVLVLVVIIVAVVANGQTAKRAPGFSELHRIEVANAPGLEAVMGMVERSGESTSPKHYHPLGEFAFVVEGAVTIITESEPPVVIEAGESFYQPAGEWHVVATSDKGARSVVFRVVEKDKPMIVVVD